MIKCICFGRVSSMRQSYTAQVNAVKAAAIADGYRENEIAIVQGKESAIKLKEDERQTLNEMKSLIAENPSIESVYFFAIDRLSRRVEVVLNVVKEMLEKGINLVFLNPTKMTTIRVNEDGTKVENELTKLLLMLLSYGAEMEMKIKTERAVNKKEEMRENNEVTGKLIFGYMNVNRKAKLDPVTAPIVKWIFKSYNEDGLSLTKIFDAGVELGYWDNLQFRSSKASRIRQILLNYCYCGEPNNSGFVYPKLVEKEEIDKAIENMKKAVNKAKTVSKVISLAKGKIKDANTGYTLKYDGNHLKYVHKDDASNKIISASLNIVDYLVWRAAKQIKFFLAKHEDVENKAKIENDIIEMGNRINNIQNIIDKDITERFNKLYKAYVNSRGRITDEEYNREVAQIEKEEKKYKQQIDSLEKRKTELQIMLGDIADKKKYVDPQYILKITDYQHQKEIVDEVIEQITVERINGEQIIKVYSKYQTETFTFTFINRTVTNHISLFWKPKNNDDELIDISSEFEKRYTRTNK